MKKYRSGCRDQEAIFGPENEEAKFWIEPYRFKFYLKALLSLTSVKK